jgi:hypothetical protein
MKKSFVLILVLIILLSISLPISAAKVNLTFNRHSMDNYYPPSPYSNSLTISANSEYFSMRISHPGNERYFLGLGIGFTKNDLPNYDDPPGLSRSELYYLGEKDKSNQKIIHLYIMEGKK